MIFTRRALIASLPLTGAAVGIVPFFAATSGSASTTGEPEKAEQLLLPDMALGPADAAVTVIEYASITCSHCAAFNETVFPKIKAAYIDTGKIRYVLREFPLDPVAAASGVLARCIAREDSAKYFAVSDTLFRQNWSKVEKPRDTFNEIGKQVGLDEQQVGACLRDDVVFDKIVAGRIHAAKTLKVESTPTFFINGEKVVGVTPFEEFDKRIKVLLNG